VHPYKENAFDWIVCCLQFITVGFAVTPLYFVWEKLIGVHTTKNMLLCAVCRMHVILPVRFFAIAFPFFGPNNSTIGAMLVTITVYIIPCAAHMSVFRTAKQGMAGKKQHFLKKPSSKLAP
jgi:auxin influx carrier (AUX1 LAX family)